MAGSVPMAPSCRRFATAAGCILQFAYAVACAGSSCLIMPQVLLSCAACGWHVT